MEHFDNHVAGTQGGVLVRQPIPAGRLTYAEVPAPYYVSDPADDPNSGGLLEYWNILRRNKGTLALFACAGMLLGFVFGLPLKPRFKVSTSVEVLGLNENFMNMKESNPVSSSDSSYDSSEEETQVRLLQSDALLDQVIKKLDPGYQRTTPRPRVAVSRWRQLLNLPEPTPMTDRQKLIGKLADDVKVKVTPRTRVIEISVKSTDPQLAVEFLNTLSNEFIERNIEARWQTTQKVGNWLTRELNDERSKLEHSEDALQQYARNSGLIFTDENTNVATEKLQQVQQALSLALTDRIAKQSRFELIQKSPPDSLPDVLNDEGLRDSAAKITDLRRQIADLSAVFVPDYSKVKRFKAQLAAQETSFEQDRTNILSRVKNDYDDALRRERLLSAEYDSQTRTVTGQDEKAIQYNILKREVESHRQLYDTMLQQMKQSSVASALHASNVRVVDPATLPQKPVFPNFKINAAVGLISGIVLGFGFVIVRERTDRNLQQPGDAQLWTNLPELGTIPNASLDREKKFRRRRDTGGEEFSGRTSDPSKGGSKAKAALALTSWQGNPSLVAEAFRSTLTSILFVGENGTRPRALVMTSANAADGKTTVVSNLAMALAEIGRRVLVIDADLRRPRMHEIFGIENEHGLSDLLKADKVAEDNMLALIGETRFERLHVLTSGAPTHAAANLLHSPNLLELVTRCKQKYDMVLIDTPPMLQMTDARVVARVADAVVLVTRAEQTTRDALMAANQRLSEDRIRVLGTVLNDWDPKRARAGYYGQYGSAYYTAKNYQLPTSA